MREWRDIGLVGGWQVTASVCFYAIFAATAFVRTEFGVSRTLVGVAVTAALLGYILLLFPAGAVVDAYGERLSMVGGLGALALAMVVVGLAPSFPLLLVALVLVGGAYATAMPATNRAVVTAAPPGRRNLAMNVKQVGVTVGSGSGALLITAAASRGDWRLGFLVAAVVAAVVAVAFGLGFEGEAGSGSLSLPDVRGLFGDPAYRTLVLSGLFFGATVFTTTGYVVLDMTESVGAAAGVAGATLALLQVTGSVGRLAGGYVADRLPWSDAVANARVLAVQAFLTAALFVAVTVVDAPIPAAATFAVLGLFVLGFPGIYYGCLTAIVDEGEVGAATAGGQTTINAGGLVAPPLFGYLADTAGYDAGWLALAAVAVLGGLCVSRLALRRD
ncbi:MAG: MFS transporter [Haloferacaceae archaeon]